MKRKYRRFDAVKIEAMKDIRKVFGIGAAGAFLMTILMAAARLSGITTINLETDLGSWVMGTLGPLVWLVGVALHLSTGGIFALIYVWFFRRFFKHAGWREGLVLSLPHAVFSGLLMGVLPHLHPLMVPGQIPPPPGLLLPPGFFAGHYGEVTAVLFIGMHLAYGAFVGEMYAEHDRKEPFTSPDYSRQETRKAA